MCLVEQLDARGLRTASTTSRRRWRRWVAHDHQPRRAQVIAALSKIGQAAIRTIARQIGWDEGEYLPDVISSQLATMAREGALVCVGWGVYRLSDDPPFQ